MAKSVKINGVTYPSVPYVTIPLSEGTGEAKFVDSDLDDAVAATAADIKVGKKVFVNGTEITGTAAAKTADDIVISGKNVTVPAGMYDTAATAEVPVETKEVDPSISDQEIIPTSGKLLEKVTVKKVDLTATATVDNVAEGVTFFANDLTIKTGTGKFPAVTQNPTTKALTVK